MRISIVGDFCPSGRFIAKPLMSPEDSVFAALYPYLSKSQLSIVNLECPLAENSFEKIKKQGPSLRCNKKDIQYLKDSGFNVITLANNHIKDYGEKGVNETISCADELGLKYVGAGCNLDEASKTLYYTTEEETIAIINCCEHEFSIADVNTAGANPLNPTQQFYAIQRAKAIANRVIIIVHGGHEHYHLPSPRMVETYRFFIDSGADAVINHHQHCCSGYELYKEKPIFYGIGNFCFDNPVHSERKWHLGMLVSLNLGNDISFEITPFIQFGIEPNIELLNLQEKNEFMKFLMETNKIIQDKNNLMREFNIMKINKSQSVLLHLMPYTNKYLRYLAYKKLLPSFLSKKKCIQIFNVINCESHRDLMLSILEDRIYDND